ncbi:MAG: helicase-associated domain-containing protein, partial [Chloroflexota bacterium]|nr:helicase-associated domain-containing protein [Chloroflexota bacterium]
TRDDVDARQRLERSMRDAIASRFVWERLSDEEQRVLFCIVGPSARNWQLVEQAPERSHLEPAVALAAIERLAERNLIYIEEARVQGNELVGQRATFYGYATPRNPQAPIEEKRIAYVPTELATGLYTTGREIFIANADRSSKTLDDLLAPYRQGDLDQIGRRFGLTMQSFYSRNEVRAAMAENLTQAEAVRYALARVEPLLRDVYEWLRTRNGKATAAEVRKRFRLDDIAFSRLLHALEDYALVFDTFSDGQRALFIPYETLVNLRRAEARPEVTLGLEEVATPPAIRPSEPTFLWDIAALTAAASQQDIELTRAGSLPKRAAQRVLPTLSSDRTHGREADGLAYVEMLKQEGVELGVIAAPPSTSRRRETLTVGDKLNSWSLHDLVMQARRLFKRWPTDRWWIDLPGANYHEWHNFYLELPLAREAVADLLRQCKPGVWYSLTSFLATIQGSDPYVLRPSQRCAGEAGFKLAEELRAHWDTTDGEIITGMFRSTLFELGFVALGYDRDAPPTAHENYNPDAFMLTDLGYEALHSELSASQQPSPRSLIIQPNFQVFLMEPHMPALFWLARYASMEQIGRVSRFTFTRETLWRGLSRPGGATIDEVIGFLERHSQKALPQNVIYTLRDWERQLHESHEEGKGAFVLKFKDESVVDRVLRSNRLKAFRLRRVDARSVVAPPEISLGDLRGALEHLGYAKTLLSGLEELVAPATVRSGSRRSVSGRRSVGP